MKKVTLGCEGFSESDEKCKEEDLGGGNLYFSIDVIYEWPIKPNEICHGHF